MGWEGFEEKRWNFLSASSWISDCQKDGLFLELIHLGGERTVTGSCHLARVHQLTGYSAHADWKGLVEWVAAMEERPKKIKLVHGEKGAREALGKRLRDAR